MLEEKDIKSRLHSDAAKPRVQSRRQQPTRRRPVEDYHHDYNDVNDVTGRGKQNAGEVAHETSNVNQHERAAADPLPFASPYNPLLHLATAAGTHESNSIKSSLKDSTGASCPEESSLLSLREV